jgi:hypothetical protein
MAEPPIASKRSEERVAVGSGTPIHATLRGAFRSVGATVRDLSLSGVSLALNQAEPSIVVGDSVVVELADTSVTATVQRFDLDRPWEPICGLEFSDYAAEIANFVAAIAHTR